MRFEIYDTCRNILRVTTLVYRRDNPFSGGIGINFETKPGIFSISYALGAQENNPILFKTAKIHFGFVNYF